MNMTVPAAAIERLQVLQAPFPPEKIQWRQDGKPSQRSGQWVARFVSFVDAVTVAKRLDDALGLGGWDLEITYIGPESAESGDISVKAGLTVRVEGLELFRESIGTGRDAKAADTDAFKRAAARFGVARHLYEMEPLWVPVTDGGNYPKPLFDPSEYYVECFEEGPPAKQLRQAVPTAQRTVVTGPPKRDEAYIEQLASRPDPYSAGVLPRDGEEEEQIRSITGADPDNPSCPSCGGRMWDNRLTKRNPKAPDFKCQNRSCEGVIWPAKRAG